MYSLGLAALSLLWATTGAQAAVGKRPLPPPAMAASTATYGQSTFEQLIDHKNPSLGTFSQQYWWSSEWWDGKGSPVLLLLLEAFSRYIWLTTRQQLGCALHPW